jgi:hypothetical protein
LLGDGVDRFMQTLVLVVECGIADIRPKTLGWNGEGVAFLLQSGELFGIGLLAILLAELLRALLSLPFVIVGEPLEEQQRKDVSLVILDFVSQAGVRYAPKEAAELLFGKCHKMNNLLPKMGRKAPNVASR